MKLIKTMKPVKTGILKGRLQSNKTWTRIKESKLEKLALLKGRQQGNKT